MDLDSLGRWTQFGKRSRAERRCASRDPQRDEIQRIVEGTIGLVDQMEEWCWALALRYDPRHGRHLAEMRVANPTHQVTRIVRLAAGPVGVHLGPARHPRDLIEPLWLRAGLDVTWEVPPRGVGRFTFQVRSLVDPMLCDLPEFDVEIWMGDGRVRGDFRLLSMRAPLADRLGHPA